MRQPLNVRCPLAHGAVGASLFFTVGCGAEARPQLVVTVDTDAPTLTQGLLDAAISPDATIDTLRVDVFDAAGALVDARVFLAVDALDWPLSFGVADDDAVTLWLRAWRGVRSDEEEVLGTRFPIPWPGVAIERVVTLQPSVDGIGAVSVLLSFGCIGAPVDFSDDTSCVSLEHGRDGFDTVDVPSAEPRVGTTPLVREIPCSAAPSEQTVCIPGGFSFLGDRRLSGYGSVSLDGFPMRPVVVSPFAMDVEEVTVGEFRAVWPLAGVDEPTLSIPGTFWVDCTWLGDQVSDNDALPLTCVTAETALAFCEARGGTLPSEAQWEHAARGRGRATRFSWGDETPNCCAASHGRFVPTPGSPALCGELGPEPPGSHPPEACFGMGDVSRDGVLDMAGSVNELMLDYIAEYDAACWRTRDGLLRDPVCRDDALQTHTLRGGSWADGPAFLLSAGRRAALPNVGAGFRCAYEVAP